MSNTPDISLCMVARGDCPLIRRAIHSVAPIVSEIVLVDVGMTPEAVQRVEDCDAQIYFHPWEDDWSAPWNLALAKASSPWILVLEPNEMISERDLSFVQHLAINDEFSFSFSIRHYTNQNDSGFIKKVSGEYYECELDFAGFFETSEVRLFPMNPRIHFAGKNKPSVTDAIKTVGKYRIARSRIPFHSYSMDDGEPSVVTCSHSESNNDDGDWAHHLDRGMQLKQASKWEEALEALFAAIDCEPCNEKAWLQAAHVLSRIGRYEEACSAFEAAISIKRNNHEAYCGLGIVALWQKNLLFAEKCFRKALSLNDKYVDGYCNLGKTLILMGKQRDAEKMFLRALKLVPQSGRIKADLGVLYLSRRQLGKAEQLLLQALQDDPGLAKGYYDLCQVYKATNNIRAALPAMEKYLELAEQKLDIPTSEEYRRTVEKAQREYQLLKKRARISPVS
jgi:Flp pilus assembly protein TadD